ncbi:hypothetical protein FHX42_004125 [Saccharopolyspora lacisalsi]|uniref:DUF3071 domain-containing protein n=1 Tax=Halosaccharopolyspora lacisalsi TaxID=1000566 RepID=A0A839E2F4_9PSEU|nr:septation protein SepH [Halosaccharopolyspora lacisalsi]MBA8826746.1 hypothetical protein [Halosaccharopolyspora lacisalsi]
MRALRVVGLDEDGETVICEDPDNGERFSLLADERLRAAARGDLTRLGQVQIELESSMRPREIQARIRAGASVSQVSEASGIPEQRVERYAYPVLLERAQTAERAQHAHPVREDGPDVQTLSEVVAHTFGMRGHEYADTSWDAWRGDDNKWVVRLSWQAGRSENTAHWVFHPGAHGGTVAALDGDAADLLDPSPNRPLRTVRPVTELAREALELDQPDAAPEESADAVPAEEPAEPEPHPARGLDEPEVREFPRSPVWPPQVPQATAEVPAPEPPEPGTEDDVEPDADDEDPEQRQARKNHPIVPSWEDVLLGVRSHR